MSELEEKNQEIIKWGIKGPITVNTTDSDTTAYKSFTYRGVQYSQYDCVYLYREGATETDIGKLVKIWWSKRLGRRGRVLWFFRPMDISRYLSDYKPSWNELFLASGEGSGLSNIIPLEAIVGKCNIVCTSKDSRNNLPSHSDMRKANYFFSHVFNVGDLRISNMFPDSIGTFKVERLLNWNQDKSKVTGPKVEVLSADTNADAQVKDEPTRSPEKPSLDVPSISEYFEHHSSTVQPPKKRKILVDSDSIPSQDARKWFNEVPWSERVKEAHERGVLVHLINLDPSHTSSDVKDIISAAFKLKANAKIIPQGPSFNSLYGQALVIFNTKDDTDFVINELKKKCLIVGEGRPLIARKSSLIEPGKASTFPGHFVDKYSKIKSDKRKVVNTSHCTQANTIEHMMALQWRILQKKCDLWWEALYEDQTKEFSYFKNLFMKNHPSDEVKASDETKASEEASSTSVSPFDHDGTPSESDQASMVCVANT